MQEITYDVPDVSCEHCINSISKATRDLGVNEVEVDLASKKVFVSFDPAKVSEADLKSAIEEEGYDIAGQTAGRAIPGEPGDGKKNLNLNVFQVGNG